MSFMKPEVYYCKEVVVVETLNEGTVVLDNTYVGLSNPPANFDALDPYVQSLDDIGSVEFASGWLARLSAPGYMDCTEFTVHKTEQEAREHLIEMYFDEEE